MSIKDYEYHNIIWPLGNSPIMRSQHSVAAVTTPTYVDLKAIFGRFDTGHALSVQADGGKIYIALGSVPTASISTAAGSTGTLNMLNQAWPIPDGVSERYFKPVGHQVGGGTGTLIGAPAIATTVDYRYLQYFGSGTLRMYRSSLDPHGTTEAFPVAGARVGEPIS